MPEKQQQLLKIPCPRCPYCHDDVLLGTPQQGCSACRAWHHQACWDEAGSVCSACGASEREPEAQTEASGEALQLPYAKLTRLLMALFIIVFSILFTALYYWWRGRAHVWPVLLGVFAGSWLGSWISTRLAGRDVLAEVTPAEPAEPEQPQPPPLPHDLYQVASAHFAKAGISPQHEPFAWNNARVLVASEFKNLQELIPPLEEHLQRFPGQPLLLFAEEFSGDLLLTVKVNGEKGVFEGACVRAQKADLLSLVEATGAELYQPGGEKPIQAGTAREARFEPGKENPLGRRRRG